MVSVETPSERACLNSRQLVERRAKIILKYGQCVGLGVVLVAKLDSVSEKSW